jgi:hypothetical protein
MADLRRVCDTAMGFIGDLQLKTSLGKGSGPRETAEAFDRYARAVRLTIAMERRLQAEEQARLAHDPLDEQTRGALAILAARSAAPGPEEADPAERRRGVLENFVPELIHAYAGEHASFDRGEADREFERLLERDIADEDVMNRPILEVVALICKELGVEPDWSLWNPESWTDPHWGLAEAEVAPEAHPNGPYEPCTRNWTPPGSVMPLPPKSLPSQGKDGPRPP